QLERGSRLVELLKQPNYSPYAVEDEVVSVWAGTEGKLDDVPVGEVRRFESEFLQYLRHSHKSTLDAIAATRGATTSRTRSTPPSRTSSRCSSARTARRSSTRLR